MTTPIHAGADAAASAELREIDGRRVVWFRIAGGKHHGAIGVRGGATVERAVQLAGRAAGPARRRARHVGRRARATASPRCTRGAGSPASSSRVSGSVPTLLAVTGACVSGPALALGLFDHVVMTDDAFAFVTGPTRSTDFTGVHVTRAELGGSACTTRRTGVASLVVDDEEQAARRARSTILSYLPDHHLADPPRCARPTTPATGHATVAATAVPERRDGVVRRARRHRRHRRRRLAPRAPRRSTRRTS